MGEGLMRLISVAAALFALVASGCQSQVPMPATYDLTYQQKMQAAYHWQVLARDLAAQVDLRMAERNLPPFIYVDGEGGGTAFDEAFHDMLITELVDRGYQVYGIETSETTTVAYKTQVVKHASGRWVRPPVGTFAALGAGILAVREIIVADVSTAAVVGGVAVAATAAELGAGSVTSLSDTEVIITTSLVRNGSYLARYSDIYYIPDNDAEHYETELVEAELVVGDTFIINYDSYERSLHDVRLEAIDRCARSDQLAELIARDFGERIHTAEFRCYRV